MRPTKIFLLTLFLMHVAVATVSGQSLAEAARREAERRRKIEKSGIAVKVIRCRDVASLAPGGNISTSRPEVAPPETIPRATTGRESLRSFRTRIEKLDRETRTSEQRLALLRKRFAARRWAPQKSKGGISVEDPVRAKLRLEIQDLEAKIKALERERADAFHEGRKAGFLPGELEGRGIIP